jgi:hypothetical protein
MIGDDGPKSGVEGEHAMFGGDHISPAPYVGLLILEYVIVLRRRFCSSSIFLYPLESFSFVIYTFSFEPSWRLDLFPSYLVRQLASYNQGNDEIRKLETNPREEKLRQYPSSPTKRNTHQSTMASSTTIQNNTAPKALFPDGLKTSGQHNPIYSQLTPPSKFPKEISGPTVWKAEDYRDHPERWTHVFSEEEIEELGSAADEFIRGGRGLTAMAKVSFCPWFGLGGGFRGVEVC